MRGIGQMHGQRLRREGPQDLAQRARRDGAAAIGRLEERIAALDAENTRLQRLIETAGIPS